MRIEVENLACRRSGRLVFQGLSFSLATGEALLVTGRNGAGKSSLLAILAGRLAAEAGAIRVERPGERTLPEMLHLVGHRDALKSALTAQENLAFARDLLGDPDLSPRDALAAVGLGQAAELPVAYLSAGQRRRVALARLLVARGRSGSSTSRPRRSTPRRRRCCSGDPGTSCQRRAPRRGDPRPAADRQRAGAEARAMTRAFLALIARDLRLAARIGGSGALVLVFFLMFVTLVPFALGSRPEPPVPHRPGDPVARRRARDA